MNIDKGVPIPPRPALAPNRFAKEEAASHRDKYPWRKLEIGDSFEIEIIDGAPKIETVVAQAARTGAWLGIDLITRRTENGIRVWRVA